MHFAKKLQDGQMHLTDTVQKNQKGLPKDLKRLPLQNHEKKVFRHPGNLLTLCWKNKRSIFMLRLWHICESETCMRRVRDGKEEEVEKPMVISNYTEHVGAVDRANHYCASCSFTCKKLRWWRKNFLAGGGVCGDFCHPVQESNWTTRTRHWAYKKTSSCNLLEQLGTVMPKNEESQVRQMITKGFKKYHILSQIPAVDEIKSAWYVLHGSRGNQLSTIAKLARKNLVCIHGKCFKNYLTKQTYKQ